MSLLLSMRRSIVSSIQKNQQIYASVALMSNKINSNSSTLTAKPNKVGPTSAINQNMIIHKSFSLFSANKLADKNQSSSNIRKVIEKMVKSAPVVIFIKGKLTFKFYYFCCCCLKG
jgi:hypothetical protein